MTRKRFFCTLMAAVLMTQLLFTAPVYANEESLPDISWFDPYNVKEEYHLYTEAQLLGLAQLTRTQYYRWDYGFATFEDITIVLQKDIHMNSDWTPVGFSETHPFAGVFDGNGHTIYNIRLSDSDADNNGTFGYVTGTVKNLKVTGRIYSTGNNTGGIAGSVAGSGSIKNCTSEIQVTGNSGTGGIVGENNAGTIIGCTNSGDVTGNFRTGGIVGENRAGTVTECINEGEITSNSRGIGTYGTGGICGRSVAKDALIMRCHNKGNICSENECAGGIAGYCNPSGSTIKNCSNSGTIQGDKKFTAAGGIAGTAGENGVIIINCYNIGPVKGKYPGGILGEFISVESDLLQKCLKDNYYSEVSASQAIGLCNGIRGKRNYTGSAMAKSHNYLESSNIFTRQKVMAETENEAILEHINQYNKHNFIDLFSNGKKYKGEFKRNAAEYLQIINRRTQNFT